MHYLGEVENICTALWQIYSGKYVQNYQNRLGFIDEVTKRFVCVFRFTVPIIAVHLQYANAKFHTVV